MSKRSQKPSPEGVARAILPLAGLRPVLSSPFVPLSLCTVSVSPGAQG